MSATPAGALTLRLFHMARCGHRVLPETSSGAGFLSRLFVLARDGSHALRARQLVSQSG